MKPFYRSSFGTAILILLFSTTPLFPEDFLSGAFWVEYEPIVAGVAYPQSEEEAARLILEEARFVFSGMIYGFTFRYTPSDTAREVEETFALEPIHAIPWGDENLRITGGRVDREFYRAEVLYRLEDFQEGYLSYWSSNTLPSSSGMGAGDLFQGTEGKYDALREGVKEAIRNYLRPRFFNKPREITGEAVLTEAPYVIIDAGRYHARVRVKLDIRELRPYVIY
ncbi:MAG: hypothetical protein JW760_11785 [Spirochaetales bacterium]|nr:hypothetical protein [Spirochaetales bacterium]